MFWERPELWVEPISILFLLMLELLRDPEKKLSAHCACSGKGGTGVSCLCSFPWGNPVDTADRDIPVGAPLWDFCVHMLTDAGQWGWSDVPLRVVYF